MGSEWKSTEKIISSFIKENEGRTVTTLEAIVMDIDPQKIIGINDNYEYSEIINDYKMKPLKESVTKNGWRNINIQSFCLLMFPNGDLVVTGAGNHRAVLAKELAIPSVRAMVAKVVYTDED
ncbi:hypothetical protein [Clostridium folliculivorans]|uniref:Uncharacterized protein n=1 Tax=Clostridium folliculivorans TaxID=2886038 RepID=A0A9W6D9H1_9CLOT|nr:hypothetical protein [Clostridium folliculivorans]GKU24315.1 hypothetical protein CFOLD11_11410 [Clostridium folliculivorans]GKU30419.1 hypothetical protein CFB3_25260 [Clostridium folliculivorans]